MIFCGPCTFSKDVVSGKGFGLAKYRAMLYHGTIIRKTHFENKAEIFLIIRPPTWRKLDSFLVFQKVNNGDKSEFVTEFVGTTSWKTKMSQIFQESFSRKFSYTRTALSVFVYKNTFLNISEKMGIKANLWHLQELWLWLFSCKNLANIVRKTFAKQFFQWSLQSQNRK